MLYENGSVAASIEVFNRYFYTILPKKGLELINAVSHILDLDPVAMAKFISFFQLLTGNLIIQPFDASVVFTECTIISHCKFFSQTGFYLSWGLSVALSIKASASFRCVV